MQPGTQFGLIVENIGAGEIVVIAFLALVILGPDRIPEMARGAGRLLHNAKKFTSNLSGDMAEVINDPAMQPIRELGEFATRPRQKLSEYALEAEAEERQKASAELAAAHTAHVAATEGDSTDPEGEEDSGSPGKPAHSVEAAGDDGRGGADGNAGGTGSEGTAPERSAEPPPATGTGGEGPAGRP